MLRVRGSKFPRAPRTHVISHHYIAAAKFEHFFCVCCPPPPPQKEPPLRENYYPWDRADDIFLARLLLMPQQYFSARQGVREPSISGLWRTKDGLDMNSELTFFRGNSAFVVFSTNFKNIFYVKIFELGILAKILSN